MIEVLDRCQMPGARPGTHDFARRWLAWAPGARALVAEEAAALAKPSLRPSSLAAVGRTGLLAARTVGPGLRGDVKSLREKPEKATASAAALRHLQELVAAGGPTYVKLGQFVATAQGLLPNEWVEAFGWCRDTVPALAPGAAEQIIESAFGAPLERLLRAFDPEPIGAASIGQVHAAELPDGTAVVVKVRRPGLRARFEDDLRAMALAAAAAEKVSTHARLANLSGFVQLFAGLLLEEIDFRFEAVNQIELSLASEDAGHDFSNFPRPIPSLVGEDVLVMTRVDGVAYDKALATYPEAVDGERLLRLAITAVLEHTLAYGVFHGDLHAGNVLISAAGDFSLIDFGIAGRCDAEQRAALVRFLAGFARNDTLMQLRGLQGFGAIPPTADLKELAEQMEARLRAVDPSLLDRSAVMSVDKLGTALGAVIRVLAENQFSVPKELVLFFKNLLYLNGFAATLAPNANLFDYIEPVFGYFMQRYPNELAVIVADVMGEPDGN